MQEIKNQEIKNPGFEEGTPNNWLTFGTGKIHKYIYPEPGRLEGYSAAIEYQTRENGKMAMFSQDVNIDPTNTYKMSGYLKAENIVGPTADSGAGLQIDWKDGNRNYLSTSVIMPRQKGSFEWKYFERQTSPDKGAKIATIILVLNDCSGKVWFDDISVESGDVQKRYKCTNAPNYQCVEDVNGPYTTLNECLQKCKGLGQYHECIVNYCQFRFKEFRLMNNKWSQPNAKQAVWYYDNNGLGWNWERSDTGAPNYPEFIVGMLPGENTGSTTPIFPIKVGDIKTWVANVGYEYLEKPAHIWDHNTGYDIYIVDPANNQKPKKSNFMVWAVGRYGRQYLGDVTDGINVYEYHYKPPYFADSFQYFQWHGYILKDQTNYYPKGTLIVDLKRLLDITREKDRNNGLIWNPNWLIRGTEFGTECYGSKGKVKVDMFEMELNGQKIDL